jgi:L-Ala-D/L-Glu epimerase
MKIDAVSRTRVDVALHETFRTAIRETDSISAIRIEIRAGERVGVGYATATPAITGDTVEGIELFIDRVMEPYLVDRELVAVERYVLGVQSNTLFGIPEACYEDWTGACSSGMAGIDLALHDLVFARPIGSPRSTGSSRSAGFSRLAQLATSVTIGADSLEAMVATAHRRVAAGFRVIKAKLGADPGRDAQRLIALAQALGAVRDTGVQEPQSPGASQLWVDANQGWTVSQALEIFEAALDAKVVLGVFEQPTSAADLDGLRAVREGVQQLCGARGLESVPVVADESARTLADVDRIIAAEAADVINVKFMKFGGITGSGVAVAKAREAGLGVLVGSMMEHPHSVAAAVDFAVPLGGVHDLDAGWWAQDTAPLRYADGFVSTVAQ